MEEAVAPSSEAARAGSASWCFGACCNLVKGLRLGLQPGTGSSSQSWVR